MAKPRCLFCDNPDATVTVEHTLSDPIRRLLPPLTGENYDGIRLSYEDHRLVSRKDYKIHTVPSFKRRIYCKGCNNGWMNDIDHAIAPLLAPMIAGHSTSLSPTEQFQVATWVTKLALVYESLEGRAKQISDAAYHEFYADRRPFPDLPVMLARYTGDEHHTFARRLIKVIDAVDGHLLGIQGVLMTITLGELIVQVMLPGPDLMGEYRGDEGSDRVLIFPPLLRTANWPPPREVDFAALGNFTDVAPF